MNVTAVGVLVLAMAVTGCSSAGRGPVPSSERSDPRGGVSIPAPPSSPAAPPRIQTGRASWYGPPHHGRKTASGEIYDMNQLTAAHRTLPLGTRVRVTNVGNGRSVVVRINDRGPFIDGRIIDLSQAAAREIGAIGAGVVSVQLEVLEAAAAEPSLPASR